MDKIIVKGARENNLKNVNIELPKNKSAVLSYKPGNKTKNVNKRR